MEKIFLASASKTRQSILDSLEIPFIPVVADIDESVFNNLPPVERPEKLAVKKAEKIGLLLLENKELTNLQKKENIRFILAADTLVCFENQTLGKPKDKIEAASFLKKLSGQTHIVATGIALKNIEKNVIISKTSISRVSFKDLSDEEIKWYISTDEWKNAAGGYKIQKKGSFFVSNIDGSFSSIAGLPLFELYGILKEQNYFL